MINAQSLSEEIRGMVGEGGVGGSRVFGFPIDVQGLIARSMDDLSLALALLGEFEKTGVRLPEELRSLVGNGDCKALAEAAHTLKGTAGIIEAKELLRLAVAMETAAHGRELEGLRALVGELGNEIERILGFIVAFRDVCGEVRP